MLSWGNLLMRFFCNVPLLNQSDYQHCIRSNQRIPSKSRVLLSSECSFKPPQVRHCHFGNVPCFFSISFFFGHNSTTFSLILLCTHCMLTFFQSCHCCPSHVHDKWQAAVQPSLCCLVLLSGKFQSNSCVKHALQDVRRSNYYNDIF